MMTTKKELTTKIAGIDIALSKAKISELYIFKMTKDLKVCFKFGKALNVESRLKAVKKDLIDWEIEPLWKSTSIYMSWLEVQTSEYEKLIHDELRGAYPKYADKYSDRPRGYTEMYDFGKSHDWEIVKFVETTLAEIIGNPNARNLEDIRNLKGRIYAKG